MKSQHATYHDTVTLLTEDDEEMTEVDPWAVMETRQDLTSAIRGAQDHAVRVLLGV